MWSGLCKEKGRILWGASLDTRCLVGAVITNTKGGRSSYLVVTCCVLYTNEISSAMYMFLACMNGWRDAVQSVTEVYDELIEQIRRYACRGVMCGLPYTTESNVK